MKRQTNWNVWFPARKSGSLLLGRERRGERGRQIWSVGERVRIMWPRECAVMDRVWKGEGVQEKVGKETGNRRKDIRVLYIALFVCILCVLICPHGS